MWFLIFLPYKSNMFAESPSIRQFQAVLDPDSISIGRNWRHEAGMVWYFPFWGSFISVGAFPSEIEMYWATRTLLDRSLKDTKTYILNLILGLH